MEHAAELKEPMNTLANIFSASEIMLDLHARDAMELFSAVGKYWENHHVIPAQKVIKALLEREQLGSTGLGQGVAIPHARIRGLTKSTAMFVRTSEALAFGSPDSVPVSLFFIVLMPAEATEEHLVVLSEVVELFADSAFRTKLKSARDEEAVFALFMKRL